jgi:hypothetical protein
MDDIEHYVDHLKHVKQQLFISLKKDKISITNEAGQSEDPQETSEGNQETYIERSTMRDHELSSEVRLLVFSLSKFKNDFTNLENLNSSKKEILTTKTSELSEVNKKFKALLSQSDSGILQRAEALDEKLEELEDLMLKKKNAKSSLYRLDSDLSSTQLANKYLELENYISNMNSNTESVNLNYIIEAKVELLDKVTDRVRSVSLTTQKLKEHTRKVVKQQDEAGKGIKFRSENESLGRY